MRWDVFSISRSHPYEYARTQCFSVKSTSKTDTVCVCVLPQGSTLQTYLILLVYICVAPAGRRARDVQASVCSSWSRLQSMSIDNFFIYNKESNIIVENVRHPSLKWTNSQPCLFLFFKTNKFLIRISLKLNMSQINFSKSQIWDLFIIKGHYQSIHRVSSSRREFNLTILQLYTTYIDSTYYTRPRRNQSQNYFRSIESK